MRKLLTVVVVLALVGITVAAMAVPKPQTIFRAHLTGANEVPPVETEATGQAIFKLGSDGETLYYKLIVANIEDVTLSHIHLGAPGVNGPVQVTLYGGPPIDGRFQGVLAEGTAIISAELLEDIREGNTYVNVHTTAWPGGEIRGQIR